MKKSFLILTTCLALAACGGSNSNSTKDASAQSATTAPVDDGSTKAEGLMASSDCGTCHKPDVKLVGPSFKDIAAKYTEADIDKLTDKVIKGGSGNWGQVAMTPHPSLKPEDAKEIIKFMLAHK